MIDERAVVHLWRDLFDKLNRTHDISASYYQERYENDVVKISSHAASWFTTHVTWNIPASVNWRLLFDVVHWCRLIGWDINYNPEDQKISFTLPTNHLDFVVLKLMRSN